MRCVMRYYITCCGVILVQDGGIDAKVTLVDMKLTDVREEAKHNAYRWNTT